MAAIVFLFFSKTKSGPNSNVRHVSSRSFLNWVCSGGASHVWNVGSAGEELRGMCGCRVKVGLAGADSAAIRLRENATAPAIIVVSTQATNTIHRVDFPSIIASG